MAVNEADYTSVTVQTVGPEESNEGVKWVWL